ncbi:putative thiosulfate sulfurtransferase, mitochondrial [Zancudomyces culisetae]|uniref:Putative thiosulfate sulfurtransferase, mitochondrial n=1 Tax=Zancudomyces culisetae TaxID=1213189 RepID=A0A1R1PXJ4_ZANCU|nr:putative thiosulfate sulfurtransferase, mitochondrial [Zancudomyces culisetae]|eukprot:OMH85663.1 putative thiosulfate sulfurtransferase, mitochondrial [Zancudomyces culisetae]
MSTPAFAKEVDYKYISELVSGEHKNALLIDVRRPDEFAAGFIPGAHNLPSADFAAALKLEPDEFKTKYGFEQPKQNNTDRPLVLYCGGGSRCKTAAVAAELGGRAENLFVYYKGYREYKLMNNL